MLQDLLRPNDAKIVLLVMDGLGGIRNAEFAKTALEAARTPNLDRLAREGACGRSLPISIGITPGSGPAHFALFGYDPLAPENDVGRGVLEVTGIGYDDFFVVVLPVEAEPEPQVERLRYWFTLPAEAVR